MCCILLLWAAATVMAHCDKNDVKRETEMKEECGVYFWIPMSHTDQGWYSLLYIYTSFLSGILYDSFFFTSLVVYHYQ